jgi:hypothetical protein
MKRFVELGCSLPSPANVRFDKMGQAKQAYRGVTGAACNLRSQFTAVGAHVGIHKNPGDGTPDGNGMASVTAGAGLILESKGMHAAVRPSTLPLCT